jgi:hypothetical protein
MALKMTLSGRALFTMEMTSWFVNGLPFCCATTVEVAMSALTSNIEMNLILRMGFLLR